MSAGAEAPAYVRTMPLDSNRLTSRLRDILRKHPAPAGATDEARPLGEAGSPGEGDPDASIPDPGGAGAVPIRELRYVPDDDVTSGVDVAGGCVRIDRHYDPHLTHGPHAVSRYADTLSRCLPALGVLAAEPGIAAARRAPKAGRLQWGSEARYLRDDRRRVGAPTSGPLLFFDLETTGLSGGAGTLAFLVGCGYFEDDGFHTLQFFLSGYEAERELLGHLADLTARFNGLVTFNGRTFDVPLIETRYLFHRLESPFASLPHFDMLQPARRLWRRRGGATRAHRQRWSGGSAGDAASCSLGALEEAILGVQRFDDVPGFEIPGRYFNYLRTGDLEPLQAVFEHNRLDLLSLAALTAVAAGMADEGPGGVPSPHEALAMGQIYDRLGRPDEADACLSRASGMGDAVWETASIDPVIRADALRLLAVHRRRQRRFEDAAAAWQALLASGAAPDYQQEARRALAIHHEHRARDFDAARRFAEHALAAEQDPAEAEALRHRLARLDRKLGRR
jgi:uncharacterized protein